MPASIYLKLLSGEEIEGRVVNSLPLLDSAMLFVLYSDELLYILLYQ